MALSRRRSQPSRLSAFASTFLIAWLLLFWAGLAARFDRDGPGRLLQWLPQESFALGTWLVFPLSLLALLLLPRKGFFDGGLRSFFGRAGVVLSSPFRAFGFFAPFATDQLLSLVVPARDLAFSLCFATQSFGGTPAGQRSCASSAAVEIAGVSFALFFALLRLAQSLALLCRARARKSLSRRAFECLEFLVLLLLVAFSALHRLPGLAPFFLGLWLLLAIAGTAFTFLSDLKFNCALLPRPCAPNPLSAPPSVPRRIFADYKAVFALALAALFGLSFVFTLSLSFNERLWGDDPRSKGLFLTLVGFLEICRRSAVNFFSVEHEHLRRARASKGQTPFGLPFKFDLDAQRDSAFVDAMMARALDNEAHRVLFEDHELNFALQRSFPGRAGPESGAQSLTQEGPGDSALQPGSRQKTETRVFELRNCRAEVGSRTRFFRGVYSLGGSQEKLEISEVVPQKG